MHEDEESSLENLKDVLLKCDGHLRKKICDIYGFSIQMDGDDYSIFHNGQTIGNGQVFANGSRYLIEVYSKNTGLKLDEFFTFFGDGLNSTYGKVHEIGLHGVVNAQSEYSFSFLLGLLNEISSFGVHFFNIYSTRKRISTRGKPIGRVVPTTFVRNQILGKYDEFECEVLDNYQLRLFATVFFHTAMSVTKELSFFDNSRTIKGLDIALLCKVASSRLKPYIIDGFSRQMLTKLSRPPYPFGVKELFLRCLKYWVDKGDFSAAENNNRMSFSGFSLRLDLMFEDYVGYLFDKLLGSNFEHIPKNRYSYSQDLDEERQLEPDHIYVDKSRKRLLVIEVKYSNKVAVREHVSQLVSYLDFKYDDWANYEKSGFIVYPGEFPKVDKINSFNHDLNVVRITSNIDESIYALRKKEIIKFNFNDLQ